MPFTGVTSLPDHSVLLLLLLPLLLYLQVSDVLALMLDPSSKRGTCAWSHI
jgi:hypothetical protein